MKVICIKTATYIESGHIAARKGSIYTVINVVTEKNLKIPEGFPDGTRFKEGKWYELLEIKGYTHEEFFIELPEDLFDSYVEEQGVKTYQ